MMMAKKAASVPTARLMVRFMAAVSLVALSTPIWLSSAIAQTVIKSYSIPDGRLDAALLTFAEQAGVQVVMQAQDVRGYRAPAVTGRLSREQALQRLIGAAPVVAKWINPDTVSVRTAAERPRLIAARTMAPVAQATYSAPASEPSPAPVDDIVVTARRREETSLAVPVAISAVSGQELQRRGVASIDNLSNLIPNVKIADANGSTQGGTISIRGIGTGAANPFADQAVSFNIDGAQVGYASVRRMAQMDLAQIEVLKGPQALFFGKNSPGGIISMRTADPTDATEGKVSMGYEIGAREFRGEGYFSTPLTDTLGVRVAAYGSGMQGWVTNIVPQSSPLAPSHRRFPDDREFNGRVTLKFTPSPAFNARFKFSYGTLHTGGPAQNAQYLSCPTGKPQFGDADECQANGLVYRPDLPASFGAVDPVFGDGAPYLYQRQILSSLELNYQLSDTLNLTSLSTLYDNKTRFSENFNATASLPVMLASHSDYSINSIMQEMRLASSFDFPLNFTAGGFYQHNKLELGVHTYFNGNSPTQVNRFTSYQSGDAWSLFGQLSLKPIQTVEITGGGRYSHEEKDFAIRDQFGNAVAVGVPQRSWHNFSPEATLTWRPTNRMTVYGAYKKGFLSGGFNGGGGAALTSDRSYDQQTTEGFEIGAKALMLDGTLRANLALYDYVTRGLQVTSVIVTNQVVSNAGKARTKGIEADMNWRTPLTGLSLYGALAYSNARYGIFTTNCYRGQTIALGCNLVPVSGAFSTQDLAGAPLVRAPDWTGSFGSSFDGPLNDHMKIGLSTDAQYSSSYYTDTTQSAPSRQAGFWQVNAAARLHDPSDRWELAVIGTNLTNKYYASLSSDNPFSGSAPGAATGVLADRVGTVSRGRQVLLRVTYAFGGNR